MSTPLQKLAAKRGLRVEERGSGHFQIIGGSCLVNYYPYSKRRSAYIAGATGRARQGVSDKDAIEMAFEEPPEGWRKPVDPTLDEPSKRTPEEWIALLPSVRFAWRGR